MKFYIVNQGGHDFETPILKLFHSETDHQFINLTVGNVNVFGLDRLRVQFKEKLEDFNAEKDYLVLSGNIALNLVAFAVVIDGCCSKVDALENEEETLRVLHKSKINVLIYNPKNRNYVPRTIIL